MPKDSELVSSQPHTNEKNPGFISLDFFVSVMPPLYGIEQIRSLFAKVNETLL